MIVWKSLLRVVPPLALVALAVAPSLPVTRSAGADAAPVTHVIRPGDTLSAIAYRYGIGTADLRKWNTLADADLISVDGLLRLTPPAGTLPPWRSRVETVTAEEANGNPTRKCPVPAGDLRRIWVRYLDFTGVPHDGTIIMHRDLVTATRKSFAALYRLRFPILVMQPASVNMPGLTDKSILTSGYECRYVAGTTRWSQHSYGRAIDVNPRQNPMIRGDYLDPPRSEPWIPRDQYLPGMLHGDGAVAAFTDNGFYWGGRWKTLKDYMHFSPNDL
ncbi:M15 family metallopeptidase [Actinoplanes sp. NBRC 101535]|uniref:M15 family metallopeptidase n=1 Tax=Actinoplanes sp. NBRC 101535 TaxID=3032196 RepID=UPI0024A4BD6F|nr:M15 family metallopeptidase [Actinoplanes sp. NBRC 101535]GLY02569.1 hypothetical protein Acsp01_29480 [Actinoplanes sp. NBRC 101535]